MSSEHKRGRTSWDQTTRTEIVADFWLSDQSARKYASHRGVPRSTLGDWVRHPTAQEQVLYNRFVAPFASHEVDGQPYSATNNFHTLLEFEILPPERQKMYFNDVQGKPDPTTVVQGGTMRRAAETILELDARGGLWTRLKTVHNDLFQAAYTLAYEYNEKWTIPNGEYTLLSNDLAKIERAVDSGRKKQEEVAEEYERMKQRFEQLQEQLDSDETQDVNRRFFASLDNLANALLSMAQTEKERIALRRLIMG